MAICRPPMWEEYNNHDTLFPWKFTEYLIFLIKNTPQDDGFFLRIVYGPSPNEYYDDEESQGENNEGS